MAYDLTTPNKRQKLSPRREPYWVKATGQGKHLGFRKSKKGGSYGLEPVDVFGVDMDTLKGMADIVSTGLLPPGIQKQIARGQRVPDDTSIYRLPDDLLSRLPPEGLRYG